MGRSIIIKLAILLVVAALVYSVFWFFKVGQVEKQIKEFVNNNASYVSTGEVVVSGFPLSQKITIKNLKFTIPNAALDSNQVIVPHLEATAEILSPDYAVKLIEPISVENAEGNIAKVEFSKDPEITISLLDGNIAKLRYQDSGYRILGADQKVIYSASNSMISVKSNVTSDKTTNSISVSIKEIEGFDIISLYKNILEKKIVSGIKTGEIMLGNNPSPTVDTDTADANAPKTTATAPTPAVAEAAPKAPAAEVKSVAKDEVVTPTTADVTEASAPAAASTEATKEVKTVDASAQPIDAATPESASATELPEATNPTPATIADTSIVKSNLNLELEYVLTPVQTGDQQQANTPPDPTQIQKAPSQYNKLAKIVSLEFSNPLYKITVSGELSTLPDDSLPSGKFSVRVEKVDNLVIQLTENFTQMADKIKLSNAAEAEAAKAQPAQPVEATKETETPAAVETDAPAETKTAAADTVKTTVKTTPAEAKEADPVSTDLLGGTPAAPIEDPYEIFLTRVAAGLNTVSKEIAAKNTISKDGVAEFDVRREKNLDFLVNETSTREILGRF